MFNTREKKERALGVKLFLKADRCSSGKCAVVRRPQRPGMHGKSHRRSLSEMGTQLLEKQKIRFTYGVRESQMRKLYEQASSHKGVTGAMLVALLEKRLDNVVFRLGLARSRAIGRQLISHGHFVVNGRKVTIPSYQVKINDSISIRPQSKNHPAFQGLEERVKQNDVPVWLTLDQMTMEGKIITQPQEVDATFNTGLVVDYYSKIS